jgi:uncharacterized protein YkwD
MLLVLIVVFALAGNAGAQASAQTPGSSAAHSTQSQPTPKLLSAALASSSEDSAAESELLALANQRRKEAGVAPLHADEGLTNAARAHARLMVDRQQLSHQFEGERSLMPRLHDAGLWADSAGENVAYHASVEKAFESLMQSPPHRQNLLDPDFNVAGMAAFWSGGRLYVVQDFAHKLVQVLPASKRQR